ncbi:hypothetical protein [Geofilum rubicundum]|uniref:Uncharacterized protein n=1 Tax=Geofilum rubicundum JCM 15548 TaxID=1236989 RepID=A0A0E9LVY8_9BACT|nr:hypothetical protein [Geofilum rubicundum]GAO29757.1 hypothetical protein JCM15548_11980 [Geofilum rubicundum JCM 15548]
MDKIGNIEIRVFGNKGNIKLSPDNYDVKEIISMLQNIEDLLYPTNKKDRPIITYDIKEGSVKHIFKTSIQAIIGFSAVLSQIQKHNSIDFLELRTAQAIENIQNFSYQKNYDFEVKTSVDEDLIFKINPQSMYVRTENVWADAEFYFYGTLTNAGGKSKANIHLDTEEFGSLTIDTDKDYLMGQEENFLYKKFGIRAFGKQNIETGEIDKRSLQLIELIDFKPKYDDEYLNLLIHKAKNNWKGINPDEWLTNLRGDYDA